MKIGTERYLDIADRPVYLILIFEIPFDKSPYKNCQNFQFSDPKLYKNQNIFTKIGTGKYFDIIDRTVYLVLTFEVPFDKSPYKNCQIYGFFDSSFDTLECIIMKI